MTAAALAAVTLPTPAAAKTPREAFTLELAKRSSDPNFKSGFCVCTDGLLDGRPGQITRAGIQNGNDVVLTVRCEALLFDAETGEISTCDDCSEGWMPLPR